MYGKMEFICFDKLKKQNQNVEMKSDKKSSSFSF